MPQITEADRFLIDQIRHGNADGWSQLIARYQGRLLAFARGQLARKAEAEDLVQDTFLMFLQSIKSFNDEYSLETYLFTILRRKIIDLYRGRQLRACFINDVINSGNEDGDRAAEMQIGSGAARTASWYVRRDEQADRARSALAAALGQVVDRLKTAENFRDLKIIEAVFYAQIRNKLAAQIIGEVDEKQIALIKHRLIKELREKLDDASGVDRPAEAPAEHSEDSLLTEVWEQNRFTCPKRSTIGRFLLGTLDGEWQQYVDFHLNKLGCRFCQANVEDIRQASEVDQVAVRHRIYESTIGFFRPVSD